MFRGCHWRLYQAARKMNLKVEASSNQDASRATAPFQSIEDVCIKPLTLNQVNAFILGTCSLCCMRSSHCVATQWLRPTLWSTKYRNENLWDKILLGFSCLSMNETWTIIEFSCQIHPCPNLTVHTQRNLHFFWFIPFSDLILTDFITIFHCSIIPFNIVCSALIFFLCIYVSWC